MCTSVVVAFLSDVLFVCTQDLVYCWKNMSNHGIKPKFASSLVYPEKIWCTSIRAGKIRCNIGIYTHTYVDVLRGIFGICIPNFAAGLLLSYVI